MKRFCLTFVLISTVFFTFIFYSYAVNQTQLRLIPYWYATEDIPYGEHRMYRQAIFPKVYSAVVGGGFSESTFDSYAQTARSRWVSAGMPSDVVSDVSNSTVKIYGGPIGHMMAIDPKLNAADAHTAVTSEYNEGQWGYDPNNIGEWGNGIIYRNGYRAYNNTIVVVYDSSKSSSTNIMLITHELGHVFGWYGHSSYTSDLMYRAGNSSGTPVTRDINHVKQIYDLVGYSYSIT